MNPYNHSDAKVGFAGGMVCTVFTTIGSDAVLKTMVLSAVGAAVSYLVSFFLKHVMQKWR